MKENKFIPHACCQSERSRRLKTGTFKDVLALILMKNVCQFDFHFQIFKLTQLQIIFIILLFQLANAQNKIDKFTYTNSTVNNQLLFINDPIPSNASAVDIDNQSSTNYAYNANGQLTKDEHQNIDTIIWNVNGKVKEVQKTNGDVLSFKYDALGNRIQKKLITAIGEETTTFYTRNVSGQVIAIYEKQNSDSIKLTELTISGIGILNEEINHLQASISDEPNYRIINKKSYELKDHLGNVRVVITDCKLKIEKLKDSTNFSIFQSSNLSISDYYSYGMQMPGRNYQTENYRYGIQGKEKDNELAGNGNAYDFGARILDPRVGRWLSTDAMADIRPSLSSYNSMGNNPINRIDIYGNLDEEWLDARAKEAQAFAAGFGLAVAEDVSGVEMSHLGDAVVNQTHSPNALAIGETVGHAAAAVGGVIETAMGISAIETGAAGDALSLATAAPSGGASLTLTVPSTAVMVAGAGVAIHGASTVDRAVSNLVGGWGYYDPNTPMVYQLKPNIDLDWRGRGCTINEALNEAFRRTNTPIDQFVPTRWGKTADGKTIAVQWDAPNGAQVSIDVAHTPGNGPDRPHVGWYDPNATTRTLVNGVVKERKGLTGHIILDDVPAGRGGSKQTPTSTVPDSRN